MKNIKDITISIFAIIGFVAILSSFTNQPQSEVSHENHESHVWAFGSHTESYERTFLYNKVTGEIRKLGVNGYEVFSEREKK